MCNLKFRTDQPFFSSNKIKKNKFCAGFTILEIVITIVILAILATIAFSSYIGYTGKARDGIRISDINNIKTGLSIYKTKVGTFPKPDGETMTGIIYGKNVIFDGDAGANIGKLANTSKTPVDPFTKQYYRYGVSYNYKFFQVGATLENKEDLSFDNNAESVFGGDIVNADENGDSKLYSAIVLGNYPGYLKFSTGGTSFITNIPSLLFNFSGSSNPNDNLLMSSGTYFIVDKNLNFPFALNNNMNINQIEGNDILRNVSNSSTATLTGINITSIINGTAKIDEVFSSSVLSQFGYDVGIVSNIIGTVNPNLGSTYGTISTSVSSGIWNGSGTTTTPYYYTENSVTKYPVSCNDILTNTGISFSGANTSISVTYSGSNSSKFNDGYYFIDPDGLGGATEFYTYCDMISDGGGWSKITPIISDGQIILMRDINMQQMIKCTDLSPYSTISPMSSNSWSWSFSYGLGGNWNENGVIKSCPVNEIQYSTFGFNCSNGGGTTWKILLNNNSNPWAYADTSALPCKSGTQITNLSIFIR